MKLDTFDMVIIIIAVCLALAYAVYLIWEFSRRPRKEQLEQVRQWLLWAVTEAERILGGGTGRLKLRFVYDLFVERFPWLARIISFAKIAEMVDEALMDMREMLETNKAVKALVEGVDDDGD